MSLVASGDNGANLDEKRPNDGHGIEPSQTPVAEMGEFEKAGGDIHTDIAYGLYKQSLEMDPAYKDLVAKKVLRKLDFIVLPMVRISLKSHTPYIL